MSDGSKSTAAERAAEYINSEFDRDAAEAWAPLHRDIVEVRLYPPGQGFLDPVHVNAIREYGFELKAVYTTRDRSRSTIVDFQRVITEEDDE